MQLKLLESYQQPIRWDNVENEPNWVAGPKPIFEPKWGMYRLRLEKDLSVTVRLTAYEQLRFHHPKKLLSPTDFQISLSDGSGLQVEHTGLLSVDGHTLWMAPHASKPLLAHIRYRGKESAYQDIAIFVSRHVVMPELAPYREWIPLNYGTVWLSEDINKASFALFEVSPIDAILNGLSSLKIPELFWHVPENKPDTVWVEGPSRLKLRHRLCYKPEDVEIIQEYRLRYGFDQQPWKWLNLSTSVETSKVVSVNTAIEVVGREEQIYLEVPEGRHQLTLMADKSMYLQLRQQTEHDYLIPSLNEPEQSVQAIRKAGLLHGSKLTQDAHVAEQIARDNMHREGGLIASELLRQTALQRQDDPTGLSVAEVMKGRRSVFRDILPINKPLDLPAWQAYFLSKELAEPTLSQQDAKLADQHQPAAMNRIASSRFTALGSGKINSLDYWLPKREAPTGLRIVVDKSRCSNQRFTVQFDQDQPFEVQLDCQNQVGDDAFLASLSETAWLSAQKTQNEPTLQGFFASQHPPAQLISVATFERILPKTVERIHISANTQFSQPLFIALQYRAGKPFLLTEFEYRQLVAELPLENRFELFTGMLKQQQKTLTSTEQSLQNEWQSLLRLLQASQREFKASVSTNTMHFREGIAEQTELQSWEEEAKIAMEQGDYIQALEKWGKVARWADNDQRHYSALLFQAINLVSLGERYLADSLLKYLCLYGDAETVASAAKILLDDYRQQDDRQALLALHATLFMIRPTQANLVSLLKTLYDNQEYRFVMLLGLALAENTPRILMVQSAYQLRWWHSFSEFVAQLDPQSRAFWLGMQAQLKGDDSQVTSYWKNAAPTWLDYWQQGQKLRNTPVRGLESKWVKDTLQWQQGYPGSRQWQDASWSIVDYLGADHYYAIGRDLHDKAFRGMPERPVVLQVLGPSQLKLQVRPLHPLGSIDTGLDGWINIQDNKQRLVYPFNNNVPSKGLELLGQGRFQVGGLESLDYQVGEGWHRIEIASAQAPISVKVEQSFPEWPLSVLPLPTPETISAALTVANRSLVRRDRPLTLIHQNPQANLLAYLPFATLPSVTPIRFDPHEIPQTNSTSLAVPLDVEQQNTAASSHAKDTAESACQQMIRWLWIKERQGGGITNEVLAQAEELAQRFPKNAKLQSFWMRLAHGSEWLPVPMIVSEAGIRFIQMAAWEPESQSERIRRLFLSPIGEQTHVLSGDELLVYTLSEAPANQLSLRVKIDEVPFLPEMPARLNYQIDDQVVQGLTLTRATQWQNLNFDLPAGNHQLRFWLDKPVSNQYVQFEFPELLAESMEEKQRPYFVSTHQLPVQFTVHGPAQLRIDEWRDGQLYSTLQSVAEGWQHIELAPEEGQHERLLRVKQRQIVETNSTIYNRMGQTPPVQSVAAPDVVVNDTPPLKHVSFKDAFKLGRQEDGTWTMGFDLVRRNNVQEDRQQRQAEQFGQYRLNYRYFDDIQNVYWNTQAVARGRELGGPTVGLNESVYFNPEHLPFNFNATATGWMQTVHDRPEWYGQISGSINQSYQLTPKTKLLPEISLFAREMSLRNQRQLQCRSRDHLANCTDTSYDGVYAAKVDQDIYTPYKADHTSGMNVAFLLQHRPWLDTLWTASVASHSNENMNVFNPDNIHSEAHWKQLFGEVSMDAGYRVSFYQPDKDRTASSQRSQFKLELDWQHWLPRHEMFELSGYYMYDIERQENLGMISLSLHFSEGRDYRDFRPGEIDFSDLRQRKTHHGQNNQINHF